MTKAEVTAMGNVMALKAYFNMGGTEAMRELKECTKEERSELGELARIELMKVASA